MIGKRDLKKLFENFSSSRELVTVQNSEEGLEHLNARQLVFHDDKE